MYALEIKSHAYTEMAYLLNGAIRFVVSVLLTAGYTI